MFLTTPLAILIGSVISALSAGIGTAVSSGITARGQDISSNTDLATTQMNNQTDILTNAATNKTNIDIARLNNAHELYMKRNEYQMKVNDLKKAGLNPALALGGISSGTTSIYNSSSASNNSGAGLNTTAKSAMNGGADTALIAKSIIESGIENKKDTIRKVYKNAASNARDAVKMFNQIKRL